VTTRCAVVSLLPMLLLPGCFSPEMSTAVSVTAFSDGGSSGASTAETGATTGSDDSDGPITATTAVTDSSSGAMDDASDGSSTAPGSEASSGGGPLCGDGNVDDGEECDDANADDSDDCLATCVAASCGDGFVQTGVETCDDGNDANDDDCLVGCIAAGCGDGFVRGGVEDCDDANANDNDACLSSCAAASCGDGFVQDGVEQCDGTSGCSASCAFLCGNPGGGDSLAENGTGLGVMYCYVDGDTVDTRASKACESHFGIGACCLILGGYNGLQYGQCGADGGPGTIHWHPDAHPDGHCDPLYVVGDVVSPGWCGTIIGNFLD
jgi:cysteine-rich repeat protein